jgi:hypothetical protein
MYAITSFAASVASCGVFFFARTPICAANLAAAFFVVFATTGFVFVQEDKPAMTAPAKPGGGRSEFGVVIVGRFGEGEDYIGDKNFSASNRGAPSIVSFITQQQI